MNINKHHFIIIIAALLFLIGIWYVSVIFDGKKALEDVFYETETTTLVTTETSTETETETEKQEIKVYITGEIKKPGVYSANDRDRICDIVEKAGGFTEKADSESINMAAYINDEEHIVVANIDDKNNDYENQDNNEDKVTKIKIESSIQGSIKSSIQKNNNKLNKIDINKASAEELKTIKGIGDVLSQNIIEYREKNGPFKSIEEIKNVSRIGNKLFEKIKDFIKVS